MHNYVSNIGLNHNYSIKLDLKKHLISFLLVFFETHTAEIIFLNLAKVTQAAIREILSSKATRISSLINRFFNKP